MMLLIREEFYYDELPLQPVFTTTTAAKTYDEVISAAKSYVDFEKVDFYEYDLFVWANVKYGDMQHITTDAGTIIRYAISELSDSDFPFYPASQRAYCWLKKHIEQEEQ